MKHNNFIILFAIPCSPKEMQTIMVTSGVYHKMLLNEIKMLNNKIIQFEASTYVSVRTKVE